MSGLQFGEQTREQFVPKYPSSQAKGQYIYKYRSIQCNNRYNKKKDINSLWATYKGQIICEANPIKFSCRNKFLIFFFKCTFYSSNYPNIIEFLF